jgi:vacuolar-type H+-ATPase subunit I/STV1
MNKQPNHNGKRLLFSLMFAALAGSASANTLEQVQTVGEKKLTEAVKSQAKIDKVVDSAQARLIRYRSMLKQIEGLKAYNEQLQTQVSSQENLIKRFDDSINQVALIERQMSPLVSKMAMSLDEYIGLDLPFHLVERQERMAFIQESLQAADVNVAEKFRQVIEAYQIENEYGRKVDSYQDIVTIDGSEYEVDILRVGRIALVCQTKDTTLSARWNHDTKAWETLDTSTYRNSIREGIKMAKKQASIDLLTLPISAPEKAQ